jgi:hypothetical protein
MKEIDECAKEQRNLEFYTKKLTNSKASLESSFEKANTREDGMRKSKEFTPSP